MKIPGKVLSRFKKYLLRRKGVKIGKNVYISHHCFIDTKGELEIGDNVFITRDCIILTHTINKERKLKLGKVVIEDNVFVGVNSVILMNVTLGKNSTIGASSIVTKDVKPSSIFVNKRKEQ